MTNSAASSYLDGSYGQANPGWHVEDSEWKAGEIAGLVLRNGLSPRHVREIGCGAGGILDSLGRKLPGVQQMEGWDISPEAIELARIHETSTLTFHVGESPPDGAERADLLVVADVIEHVEDPFAFVRGLRTVADRVVFHIPLDMNVQLVLRAAPIMRMRRQIGHLHYFSFETALALLEESGFQIEDHCYTAPKIDRTVLTGRVSRLVRPLRVLGFRLDQDMAVRIFGGFSLLVLVRAA